MNPTSIHEDAGSIPGPTRCVKDLALLWLWRRPAAVAPIWPLAQELPYAADATPPKKIEKRKMNIYTKEEQIQWHKKQTLVTEGEAEETN